MASIHNRIHDFLLGRKPQEESQEQQTPTTAADKPDLIEYLQSLPDVEVSYPPFEEDPPKVAPTPSLIEEITAWLQMRSKEGAITSTAMLCAKFEGIEELVKTLETSAPAIKRIHGDQQDYFFTAEMTENYAKIMLRIEERNVPKAIAEVVRTRSHHPAVTPFSFFTEFPYFWTAEEVKQAYTQMSEQADFEDIAVTTASNGKNYFYSRQFISDVYGKALAEDCDEIVY